MDSEKLQTLWKTASLHDFAVQIKTVDGQKMILNPRAGPLSFVDLEGVRYIKLKRTLLSLEDITNAYLYSTTGGV